MSNLFMHLMKLIKDAWAVSVKCRVVYDLVSGGFWSMILHRDYQFKGLQLDVFCHRPYMYCILSWIQTSLLFKNLKLFQYRVKELFEPIVLHLKKRQGVFALSKRIFLRNRSLSNIMDFELKKQNWEGKSVFN